MILPRTTARLTNLQLLSVHCPEEWAFRALTEVLPMLTQLTCLVSGLGRAMGAGH